MTCGQRVSGLKLFNQYHSQATADCRSKDEPLQQAPFHWRRIVKLSELPSSAVPHRRDLDRLPITFRWSHVMGQHLIGCSMHKELRSDTSWSLCMPGSLAHPTMRA